MVAAVATASALVLPLLSSAPAQADPRQHTSQLVAVGSDTLNEVTNAMAGQSNDTDYAPVHSDLATGRLQMTSWGGVAPGDPQDTFTCIAPKKLLNAFQRPNGSGQGRAALSRAIDGTAYHTVNPAGDGACDNKSTSGIVDFARSSSLGSATGTDITYVPFARDALDYAYALVPGTAADTAVTDLTDAEITSIFTETTGNGTAITRGAQTITVFPCEIQNSSGTAGDWAKKVTGNSSTSGALATVHTASATCTGTGTAGPTEENRIDQLQSRANDWQAAHAGASAQFVIGHTVSSFIAQSNHAAPEHIPAATTVSPSIPVGIGSVRFGGSGGNLIAPTSGTAPTLTGNPAFYGCTAEPCSTLTSGTGTSNYGRTVNYAVPSAKVVTCTATITTNCSSSGQFLGLKDIFTPTNGSGGNGSNGGTALICSSDTVTRFTHPFGFLQLGNASTSDLNSTSGNCGSIAVKFGLENNS